MKDNIVCEEFRNLYKAAEAYCIALNKLDVLDDGDIGAETMSELEFEYQEQCHMFSKSHQNISDSSALAIIKLIECISILKG